MKKPFTLLLAALLATASLSSLSACGNEKEDNCIYVGLECGYIPFNWTQMDDSNDAVKISNAEGYANGYDVMIAKKIAEGLNKELVIVKYEWNALVPAVVAGTLDFIIAGMSPTEERLEVIDFSSAYYQSQLVVVVKEDSAYANATSLAELSGAKIVAQNGTFHDTALNAQGATYGILRQTPMEVFPLMTAAVLAGTVDGYVAEEPGAIADCLANEGLSYVPLKNNTTGFTASDDETAIAVGLKKGSPLKDQVNSVLSGISQEQRDQIMDTAKRLAAGNV